MTAVRLIAWAPNGPRLGPLPTPISVQAGYVLNDVGALSLTYHPGAARSDLLGQPLEIVTEVSTDGGQTWVEPDNGRFLYLRDGRDPIKTDDAYSIDGPSYLWRLQKALVGTAGLTDEGRREYVSQMPGAILLDLFARAQSRGALTAMDISFTGTVDSNGTPWPTAQSISYEPGANLLAVLQAMIEAGWVDVRTRGRTLDLFVAENPSGLARDLTVTATPVSLRFGRDLTEAPFRRTWEGLADTAVILGDENSTVTRTNPSAIKPWGIQETFVTASGVTDVGTLSALGDASLEYTQDLRAEHTFGLEFGATPFLPFRDYRPGDWVWAATSGATAPARMRLRQVTLTRDEKGAMAGNVVLNDRFLEADVLQARAIAKITAGATQSGGPGAPSGIGPDILAPKAPTGLGASSAAYVDNDGFIHAQITLNWNDVTTNADNTPTNDVDHYEVWGRVPSQTDWRHLAETTLSQWTNSPYDPGTTWEFQVRAVDTSYNVGGFSAVASTTTAFDLTPPPQPSAPTAVSRLGTAQVSWNGQTSTGADMAATVLDWRYTTVHVSTVNGFTPSEANRVGELSGAGYVIAGPLNYSTTYYARLVAVDSSGNQSVASAQVPIVVQALVDVSNFPDDAMEILYARTGKFLDLSADNFAANLIEGAWIKAGAITADKLTIGTPGQSVVLNGYMEDLNDAGTFARSWSRVYLNGTAPGEAIETANPISGQRSMRLNNVAADTNASYMNTFPTPGYLPVVAGQVWYVRMVVRASRALPTGRIGLRFQTSQAPSDPGGLFDSNVVWQTADKALTTGSTVIEGQFAVPANHTRMRPGFYVLGDSGGAYTAVVDSIEMWPAATDSQITEVSAGKIVTGVIQATQRLVAGSLTGARAELNGVGFQAFAPDGRKMFEVQANSGDTIVGDATSIHVRLGAYTNLFNSGISQGQIRFGNPGSGWSDGQIHSQYFSESGTNWAALRLASPYEASGGFSNVPFLDLRQNNLGYSKFYLRAQEANFTANTFIVGDGATVTDFRSFGSGFQFSDYSQTSRLRLLAQVGQFTLRAANSGGGVQPMRLQANDIVFEAFGGVEVGFSEQNGSTGFRHFNRNIAINFGGNEMTVTNWVNSLYRNIYANGFVVASDPRWKSNQKRVKGALEAVKALRVYDYDMVGAARPAGTPKPAMAKVASPGWRGIGPAPAEDQVPDVAYTARGVMADEVQAVLPNAVKEDDKGTLSVSLYDLLATALAGIQELAAEVDTLKATQSPRRNP